MNAAGCGFHTDCLPRSVRSHPGRRQHGHVRTLDALHGAEILVVDDDPVLARVLCVTLERAGYENLRTTTDSSKVVETTAECAPDLILMDVHMPAPDGLTLLADLRPWIAPPAMVPVIMLTGSTDATIRRIALERGARDFVTKPIESDELLLRIRNVLEMRRLQLKIQDQNERLQHDVRERSGDLADAQVELVERLALAAEYRDDETQEHAERVGRTAALLAERLGFGVEFVTLIRRAAPLHDVGKIGVSDAVFLKPGRFTAAETEVMRQHVAIGANILAGSSSPVLQLAEEIARSHHERWDGTGYPAGIAGEQIPLSGRLVAVADVFDALTHDRPYKTAWPIEAAVEEISACAGTHFDPRVVATFEALNHAYLLAPVRRSTTNLPAISKEMPTLEVRTTS